MIFAGIDEAGLGPALGVLSVAGAALRLPPSPNEAWNFFGADTKKIVGDSKAIFPAKGLAGLEVPILAAWQNWRSLPRDRDEFFTALGDANFLRLAREIPWHAAAWQMPLAAKSASIAALAARRTPAIELLTLQARALTAAELNRQFAAAKKSAVEWRLVAALIQKFAALDPSAATVIVVDKQGGRHFYAPLLAELFASPLIETVREGAAGSEYVVANCRVIFSPRADANFFPVALASMLAKYIRERCMSDLNAWFAARCANLRPTAGYHGDAPRFYEAVKSVLDRERIPREKFWRSR
jgi:ribonuclease HII